MLFLIIFLNLFCQNILKKFLTSKPHQCIPSFSFSSFNLSKMLTQKRGKRKPVLTAPFIEHDALAICEFSVLRMREARDLLCGDLRLTRTRSSARRQLPHPIVCQGNGRRWVTGVSRVDTFTGAEAKGTGVVGRRAVWCRLVACARRSEEVVRSVRRCCSLCFALRCESSFPCAKRVKPCLAALLHFRHQASKANRSWNSSSSSQQAGQLGT